MFITHDRIFPFMTESRPSILIKNVRVLRDGCLENAEILTECGKIAAIARECRVSSIDRVINGRGMVAIPAGIDAHVHFRDPGAPHKEDWYSGSCSAAAGGIATVLEHPNTDPAVTDRASFNFKLKRAKRRSVVDFGINGGVFNNIDKLPELWSAGVSVFGEIFMGQSTGGLSVDEKMLEKSLGVIAHLGAAAAIHAEDEGIRLRNEELFRNETDPSVHSRIRPNECEAEAVRRCLEINRRTKCRLHICHTSTPEAVALLEAERRRTSSPENPLGDPRLTCEVAPHHLFLSVKDYGHLGNHAKMNPPVRSSADAVYMMTALRDGLVNAVASDHAPHRAYEKDVPVRKAPSGVPGVETLMPLMLAAVRRNLISLERVVETTSRNPARIFDLERHGKGLLEKGYDADLILFDPKDVTPVKASRLHTLCEWTPYEGMDAIFPQMTFSRGTLIWDGEQICVSKGNGTFLPGAGYVGKKGGDEDDGDEDDGNDGRESADEMSEAPDLDEMFDGEEYRAASVDPERRKA